MKKAWFLLGSLCLWLSSASQDSPETALELVHSWASGQFVYTTFVGMDDNLASTGVGPDVWFKFTANESEAVVFLGGESSSDLGLEVALYDENMLELECEPDSWNNTCDNWTNLAVSGHYFLSITLVSGVPEEISCFSATVQDDYHWTAGDFDNSGHIGDDDLLILLSVFGTTGHYNQDLHMDGIMNISDLMSFLTI